MRTIAFYFSLLFLAFGNTTAIAQTSEAATLELSESGRSYLQAVGRRVNSNVEYYDPNLAAPELTTRERPTPRERDGLGEISPLSRHVFTAIALLILAGVMFQVWRFGAPVSVSLRSRPSDAARAVRINGNGANVAETAPMSLSEILAIDDWNAALVELARSALTKTAEQNGMRWQTSWTARDLLRRLPREVAESLRPLVRTAEHVQFGNRNVGEDEFTRHAQDIAPLLRRSTA